MQKLTRPGKEHLGKEQVRKVDEKNKEVQQSLAKKKSSGRPAYWLSRNEADLSLSLFPYLEPIDKHLSY
ncbi:hypothetical protein ACU8KH_00026 [Lachancea thermotolerans]